MAPRELWPQDFIEGVNMFRPSEFGDFIFHIATTEPLKFPVKGGTVSSVHSTSLSSIERGARYWDQELQLGLLELEDPVMHIVQPSVADPTRAPAGMHTIRSVSVQPVIRMFSQGLPRRARALG